MSHAISNYVSSLLLLSLTLVATGCMPPDDSGSESLAANPKRDSSKDSDSKSSSSDSQGLQKVSFNWKDSNKTIDGKGAFFNEGKRTMVVFESKLVDGKWMFPENITFKNWKINGVIRLTGIGPSSDTTLVKSSSRSLGHTERMRAGAPRRITISNIKLTTDYKIPVVFAPGVHESIIENSLFEGESRSVGIYVDAESGDNVFRNNIFAVDASREVIALDGSARNQVSENIFLKMSKGGVHVYRNSGERGVVRHQEPRNNVISQNYFSIFDLSSGRVIVLGSRNGTNPNYRHDDWEFPFGSGASNRDYARDNKVDSNVIAGDTKDFESLLIKDTEGREGNNIVKNTLSVTKPIENINRVIRKFDESLIMPNLWDLIEAHKSL